MYKTNINPTQQQLIKAFGSYADSIRRIFENIADDILAYAKSKGIDPETILEAEVPEDIAEDVRSYASDKEAEFILSNL